MQSFPYASEIKTAVDQLACQCIQKFRRQWRILAAEIVNWIDNASAKTVATKFGDRRASKNKDSWHWSAIWAKRSRRASPFPFFSVSVLTDDSPRNRGGTIVSVSGNITSPRSTSRNLHHGRNRLQFGCGREMRAKKSGITPKVFLCPRLERMVLTLGTFEA